MSDDGLAGVSATDTATPPADPTSVALVRWPEHVRGQHVVLHRHCWRCERPSHLDPITDGVADGRPGNATMAVSARAGSPRQVATTEGVRRPVRRCVRCGRKGRNAYRLMRGDSGGQSWLCTHEEPCHERWRLSQRAAARRASGRSPQSPITGWSADGRRVLVLSTDRRQRRELEVLLSDVACEDVECLDLDRRSLDVLVSREYGLVVADVRRGDPVAVLDGLARRLTRLAWRGATVVVVHGPGDDGPAVEALVQAPNVEAIARPVSAAALISVVSGIPPEAAATSAG